MEIYAAMVERVDDNVGRLVRNLREFRVLENTLVILFSDNGANGAPMTTYPGLNPAWQERNSDNRFENLGKRTGIAVVKAVGTSLIQAERYGTAVGQALRVLAKESRDMRMAEAEKKAAALPPKLTVPMILFFLPVLFVVILGPAVIQFLAVR